MRGRAAAIKGKESFALFPEGATTKPLLHVGWAGWQGIWRSKEGGIRVKKFCGGY